MRSGPNSSWSLANCERLASVAAAPIMAARSSVEVVPTRAAPDDAGLKLQVVRRGRGADWTVALEVGRHPGGETVLGGVASDSISGAGRHLELGFCVCGRSPDVVRGSAPAAGEAPHRREGVGPIPGQAAMRLAGLVDGGPVRGASAEEVSARLGSSGDVGHEVVPHRRTTVGSPTFSAPGGVGAGGRSVAPRAGDVPLGAACCPP